MISIKKNFIALILQYCHTYFLYKLKIILFYTNSNTLFTLKEMHIFVRKSFCFEYSKNIKKFDIGDTDQQQKIYFSFKLMQTAIVFTLVPLQRNTFYKVGLYKDFHITGR